MKQRILKESEFVPLFLSQLSSVFPHPAAGFLRRERERRRGRRGFGRGVLGLVQRTPRFFLHEQSDLEKKKFDPGEKKKKKIRLLSFASVFSFKVTLSLADFLFPLHRFNALSNVTYHCAVVDKTSPVCPSLKKMCFPTSQVRKGKS